MKKSSENSPNYLVIIVIIIVVIIALAFARKEQENEDLEEEIEDEINKIELECKKQILDKHILRNQAINRLLNRKSERYFKLIIRSLVILFIAINNIIYFTIPDFTIYKIISLNGAILFCIAILEFYIYQRVRKIKDIIIDELKPFVERKVYKKRSKEAIEKKVNSHIKEKEEVEESLDEISQRKIEREERKRVDLNKPKGDNLIDSI